ncbi:hypothetical protein [Methylobacterium sp. JK268]
MRPLLAALVLAAAFGGPVLAAEVRGPVAPPSAAQRNGMPFAVGTPYDDVDATGTLAPPAPVMTPDYGGPEIDVDAPRLDRSDPHLREFAPE